MGFIWWVLVGIIGSCLTGLVLGDHPDKYYVLSGLISGVVFGLHIKISDIESKLTNIEDDLHDKND